MRLLAAVPAYPPRSRVGAWLATHRLLVRCAGRGHDVDVFTLNGIAFEPYELDGVRVGSPRSDFDYADVVVTHCGDESDVAVTAQRLGKPSVRLHHGGVARIDHADLVVFNSMASQSTTPHGCRSIVVHPPVDSGDYRTTPGDRVTLVNLSEAKGGRLFDSLCRAMPEVPFLGVRGGYGRQVTPSHPNLEVIATTDNMRDDVYARTRILLMPSEYETWGMVGIEAMASGIPVVAHPTPGLVESLGSSGIFVDRNDSGGWADTIARLSDPGEWVSASAKATARSAELGSLDGRNRFVDAVEALCE